MTNYEWFMSLSREELATLFGECTDSNCDFCALDYDNDCNENCVRGVKLWLDEEYKENDKL